MLKINFVKKDLEKILKVAKGDITITTHDNKIKFISIVGDTVVAITVTDGDIKEDGTCLISSEILKNIPKKCSYVRIEENLIKADKRTITFNYTDENALSVDKNEFELINTVSKGDIEKILDVEYAIAKDDTRQILKNIYVNKDECCALDGYTLATRKLSENYNEFFLREDVIKLYKKFKSNDNVRIYQNSLMQKISFDNVEITHQKEQGRYVNYKSLINEENNSISIKFDIKEVVEILSSYKQENLVELNIVDDTMTMKNRSKSMTIEDTIDLKEKYGNNLMIGLNKNYLLEALKHYSSCEVTFKDSVSPIIIKEDGKLDLILPIRLIR